jgi:hypothetical protein
LKEYCANARPHLKANSVCELMALADLYGADQLKTHAVAFIKDNSTAVMQTKGWTELLKTPALINFLVGSLCSLLAPPKTDEWD